MLGCGGADTVGTVVPVTCPVGVPEAIEVEDSAAEEIGDPENSAVGVGNPELLGGAEFVWRLEGLSEFIAVPEIVWAAEIVCTPEIVPWAVPENCAEAEAAPELLGESEFTELPENCGVWDSAGELLGEPEIV
jgi:hypothetical protein